MTASLPRRRQPRVVISAHEPTALQDGQQQALIQGALLRECDETVFRLMKFSRQRASSQASKGRKLHNQRSGADDIRDIEHLVGQIVATVPENEDEVLGKAAVYREYANLSDRQPGLLAIMVQETSRELERRVLGLKKHPIGEN
ncbi:hypothetical protein IY145_01770 [Methylosinus sp. H3A]|uniref:hypothetical protein n=1 Tax=Methylosinus sp. H3A TaxID=2785786 RepID=UPI0018C1F08A|nr:hypothetical protein [Methylosinus sp. H3A]MBG0808142.1 hypothetical protein [Methylosinus sp. H3A]